MPTQRLPRGKRRSAQAAQAAQAEKPPAQPAGDSVYQLKVTLKYSKPPIWRRIQVPADISLGELHNILQTVMGWEDDHLHSFTAGGIDYGPPLPDTGFGLGLRMRGEAQAKLNKVAPGENSRFVYEYNFGDSWEHEILVEKILPAEEGGRYPICIEGKRACPPEDCGGAWGYAEFLEAIADPKHPEHEDRLDWVGEDFDPEAFDLAAVNEQLGRMQGA
jgi:Plasmid pRiA4b ORF-3-like protein